MPNIYTSKNVENGLTFDDLITKLLAYKPDQWGYTEQDFNNIKTDFNVSENSLYNLPLGNYKLKNMPNSPFNSEFVNVRIFTWNNNKKAICNIGGVIEYGTTLTEANPNGPSWQELSEGKRQDIDAAIIVVGDTVPTGTRNNFPLWVDTSKAFITGEIFLRFHGDDGVWHSYTVTDSMDMSVYDKNGIKKDPYKEVMNEVEKFIGDYAEIIMHINNELKLIHINASDKEYFDTYLLTSENVANYFEEGGEFYNEMVKYVKSTITTTTGLDTSTVNANLQVLKQNLTQHYDNHVTEVDVEYWDSKADADHTHNLDPNVTVDASDIDFGDSTIPDAAIPDSVKERPILITSLSVLKNVDTSLLDSTYHNGNMLYIANENDGYDFYKIVDNSYFNTDDYMEGVKKFSVEIGEVNFADAIKVPSDGYTLADYGITDALAKGDLEKYQTTYEEELKCEIVPSNLTTEAVGDADLYVKVEQSSDKSEINVYISADSEKDMSADVYDFEYQKIDYTISEIKLPIDEVVLWCDIGYYYNPITRNYRYIAIGYYNDIGYCAHSLTGETWSVQHTTDGTLVNANSISAPTVDLDSANKNLIVTQLHGAISVLTENGWKLVQDSAFTDFEMHSSCYGMGRYIVVGYMTDVSTTNKYFYSSDGLTWTEGSFPMNGYWSSICYGSQKFVAVCDNYGSVIYSSDGLTWTKTNYIGIDNYRNVYYCQQQFIIPEFSIDKYQEYTNYAYSEDGETWLLDKFPYYCNDINSLCASGGIAIGSGHTANLLFYKNLYITAGKWEATLLKPSHGSYVVNKIASTKTGTPTNSSLFVCIPTDGVEYELFNTFLLIESVNNSANIKDILQYRITNKETSDYFSSSNKVDTNILSTVIDKTYTDYNGNKFHIYIYWDPERGLVFASPNMVSKLITADYINKNELTQSTLDSFNSRKTAIANKLS